MTPGKGCEVLPSLAAAARLPLLSLKEGGEKIEKEREEEEEKGVQVAVGKVFVH